MRQNVPDSKVHGANMGPTWALASPGGPHVGPMKLATWGTNIQYLDISVRTKLYVVSKRKDINEECKLTSHLGRFKFWQ